MKLFNRDPKKVEALTIAKQSAAAYDYAARKGGNSVTGRGKKKAIRTEPRQKKAPYEPGKIGLSAVSEAIKENHGIILNRRMRKETARLFGSPFKKVYSGEGPKRNHSYGRRANKYG